METTLVRFIKSRRASALIAILGLSSAMWVPPAYSAKLVWEGDFETGDLSQYKKKLYNEGKYGFLNTVSSPVRHGKYAAEAIIDGGAERARAELVTSLPGGGNQKFLWDGPEYWIGFSLYFKEWNAGANTFVQLHAPNEPSGSPCDYAGNAFTVKPTGNGGIDSKGYTIEDDMTVAIIDNPSGISSGKGASSNNISAKTSRMPIGKWQDFVVRFKLSTKGDGYFEIWKNGEKVYSKFNLSNVNYKDSCGNLIPSDKRSHNGIHIGIYAGKSDQYRRMYFDEVRIAEGTNGFDLVAPAGSQNNNVTTLAPPAPPSFL